MLQEIILILPKNPEAKMVWWGGEKNRPATPSTRSCFLIPVRVGQEPWQYSAVPI